MNVTPAQVEHTYSISYFGHEPVLRDFLESFAEKVLPDWASKYGLDITIVKACCCCVDETVSSERGSS